jgi:transcriptional regulator with XRE-family HTH domain
VSSDDERQGSAVLPEHRVGAALRAARARGELSLREMAEKLGYNSHTTLSGYERGAQMPTDQVVEGYERILGLEPGTLMAVLEQARIERHGDAWAKRRVHIPTQFVTTPDPTPETPLLTVSGRQTLLVSAPPRRRRTVVLAVFACLVAVLTSTMAIAYWSGWLPRGRLANGQKVPTCADVGDQDSDRPDPMWWEVFRAAYQRYGGRMEIGCPRTNDPSGYVHQWGPGFSQDLEGGRAGRSRIMALDPQTVVVVSGDYGDDYVRLNGRNAAPLMGYPISDPISCGQFHLVLLKGGEQSPGAMVTNPRSGRFLWISKEVWSRYQELDGPFGRLGGPIGDPEVTPSEVRQTFEHGYIRVVAGATRSDLEDRGGREANSGHALANCLTGIPGPAPTQTS